MPKGAVWTKPLDITRDFWDLEREKKEIESAKIMSCIARITDKRRKPTAIEDGVGQRGLTYPNGVGF